MTAFSKLPLSELQTIIGQKKLDELREILPFITNKIDPDEIFSNKKLLAEILISFGGIDKLVGNEFRRNILNHLNPGDISHLYESLDLMGATDFDTKVEAIIKLGWKNHKTTQIILSSLDFDPDLAPRPKPKIDYLTYIQKSEHSYRQLKDYQFSLFKEASRKLDIPNSRFIIQMPTGAGKTRTAIELVCEQLNKSPRTIVWLAHSEELCEQAVSTFQEVWRHIGAVPVNLVRYFGGTKISTFNKDLPSDPTFFVASFQRLFANLRKDNFNEISFLDNVGLVIVDEAHKVIALTYKKVTKALFKNNTKCIGLTATPGRSVINLDQNKELADFFFGKIVTFDSGDQSPIEFLRDKRILSRSEYTPIVTNIEFEITAKEAKHLENFFDYPAELLTKIGRHAARNAEIVKRLELEVKQGNSILFFACGLEHSKFVCSLLTFLGVSAAHVDGNTPPGRRKDLIDKYRNGGIKVLCNYGVLATGFDAPHTDIVFISRPTASVVLYSQMIGRGLRGPEVGGTERCKIIDVKDNIIGFSDQNSIYEYFSDYWDQ
jgi:DNA repair protein RadD